MACFNCTSFQLSPLPDEAPSGGTAEEKLYARPPSYKTAAEGSFFFSKSTSLSGIISSFVISKHARKPHPTFLSRLWQGIYTAGPSVLCSHDWTAGLLGKGMSLDTKMSHVVLHLPRTTAKFTFQAMLMHTVISYIEENTHISFHIHVCKLKKKKKQHTTRLIKLFQIYLEVGSKSQYTNGR